LTTADVVATLTESNIQTALIEARGDIFVASQMLAITAIRLDRAISVSSTLQATQSIFLDLKTDPKFDQRSSEQLSQAVRKRLSIYAIDGLDALHDIATMPISENPAQNHEKFLSAARLAGGLEAGVGGSETSDILRELNAAYHASAPKIRIVRQTMTTVEMGPDEKDISPFVAQDSDSDTSANKK
jgi:hypothetical protein